MVEPGHRDVCEMVGDEEASPVAEVRADARLWNIVSHMSLSVPGKRELVIM